LAAHAPQLRRWAYVAILVVFSFWLGTRFAGGLPFGAGPSVHLTTWLPEPAGRAASRPQAMPATPRGRARTAAPHHRATSPLSAVDVNTATIDELRRALHMRRSTAQRIVDYRRRHGRFTSLDDLLAVPLSRSTIERIAPFVTFR
jgi:competence ComEA-like helix-hairpin-helix protein